LQSVELYSCAKLQQIRANDTRYLEVGKPVFLEKPLAADLAGAQVILESARKSARPTIVDFNFPELPSWQRAKAILDDGGIGRLRNVVVTWNFANQATRLRLESWKTRGDAGWRQLPA
jgi:predicted dehydrogenase